MTNDPNLVKDRLTGLGAPGSACSSSEAQAAVVAKRGAEFSVVSFEERVPAALRKSLRFSDEACWSIAVGRAMEIKFSAGKDPLEHFPL